MTELIQRPVQTGIDPREVPSFDNVYEALRRLHATGDDQCSAPIEMTGYYGQCPLDMRSFIAGREHPDAIVSSTNYYAQPLEQMSGHAHYRQLYRDEEVFHLSPRDGLVVAQNRTYQLLRHGGVQHAAWLPRGEMTEPVQRLTGEHALQRFEDIAYAVGAVLQTICSPCANPEAAAN